ncbi:hypothetical protein Bbelb_056140 [Branchiostoma belcheri]|nr:hypothetical protein Bbelb_056140 [Branchiostoma belcheri]
MAVGIEEKDIVIKQSTFYHHPLISAPNTVCGWLADERGLRELELPRLLSFTHFGSFLIYNVKFIFNRTVLVVQEWKNKLRLTLDMTGEREDPPRRTPRIRTELNQISHL